MNKDQIIQTINLSKKYKNRWAVTDINLDIRQGQVFGFLGPNGAGKSTTIRMLLSLIRPTRGAFRLFGCANSRNIYRRIGALIEKPDFYLYLSGYRNLKILADLTGGISNDAINEALEIVKLKGREHEKVKNYSHGMKQRLGIAQALMSNPELLILDEPTTGLDPEGIKEVRDLITGMANDLGITIFLSSHRLYEIEQVCTHMAIIDHGKMVIQGDVQGLLRDTNFFVTEVEVDNPDKAYKLLAEEEWIKKTTLSERILKVQVAGNFRPRLVDFLVSHDLKVSSIVPRTHLEDFYLSLIEQRGQI